MHAWLDWRPNKLERFNIFQKTMASQFSTMTLELKIRFGSTPLLLVMMRDWKGILICFKFEIWSEYNRLCKWLGGPFKIWLLTFWILQSYTARPYKGLHQSLANNSTPPCYSKNIWYSAIIRGWMVGQIVVWYRPGYFYTQNSANNSVFDLVFDSGASNLGLIHQIYDSTSPRLRTWPCDIRESRVGTSKFGIWFTHYAFAWFMIIDYHMLKQAIWLQLSSNLTLPGFKLVINDKLDRSAMVPGYRNKTYSLAMGNVA